jgi:hypothetical protein
MYWRQRQCGRGVGSRYAGLGICIGISLRDVRPCHELAISRAMSQAPSKQRACQQKIRAHDIRNAQSMF